MFSDSVIDPDTLQAYAETDYRVFGAAPFVLRVGVFSNELAALQAQLGVTCSAFVTAHNPCSRLLSSDENDARNAMLARMVAEFGLTCIAGIGQHPNNRWPGEASFLVPGATLDTAQDLGRHFEQNAIVWCAADAVPKLVLLR